MHVQDFRSPRITKRQLRRARPEDVRRLARWLRVQSIDTMSHRQLIRLLDWLFRRQEQRDNDGEKLSRR